MSASYSPDISVVIPCFNAERWIGQTLRSVLAQHVPGLEIVVVDDGSTDASIEVVRMFPEVRVIQTDNGGPSRARNIGMRSTSAQFIQFLDADDVLAPDKLRAQADALERTPADVAYGDWRELPAGRTVAQDIQDDPVCSVVTDFWCPPAAYLFRRGVVADWDEDQRVVEDVRFVLECGLAGARFVRVPGLAAEYRVHPSGGSLSTRDPLAFGRGCLRNAHLVEQYLTPPRRAALLKAYSHVARASFGFDPPAFEAAYAALRRLQPGYTPDTPWTLALTSRVVGYRSAEAIALNYRRMKRRVADVAQRP